MCLNTVTVLEGASSPVDRLPVFCWKCLLHSRGSWELFLWVVEEEEHWSWSHIWYKANNRLKTVFSWKTIAFKCIFFPPPEVILRWWANLSKWAAKQNGIHAKLTTSYKQLLSGVYTSCGRLFHYQPDFKNLKNGNSDWNQTSRIYPILATLLG